MLASWEQATVARARRQKRERGCFMQICAQRSELVRICRAVAKACEVPVKESLCIVECESSGVRDRPVTLMVNTLK